MGRDGEMEGAVAIVTGAAGGIGRATAMLLAERGADVVAVDVLGDGLQETLAMAEGRAGRLEVAEVDVADAASVHGLVEGVLDRKGRLDVLANVAGILHEATLVDTEEAAFDRVLDVNLRGVFLCCRAAVRAMRARRSGSIVNVASSIVANPVPGYAAYAISKGGVVALTRVLAQEVAADGIRVNAVAPGTTLTPMTMARRTQDDAEAFVEAMRRSIPIGRAGDPEDIAEAIVYLASGRAAFVTGQTLHVNGGTVTV